MKNIEILSALKVGSVVTNKQILSALYRKGLIGGYSEWGYLESRQVKYIDSYDNSTYWDYIELFPKGNREELNDVNKVFKTRTEMLNAIGGNEIEYLGYKFSTKYLSGCFQPYLELIEKNGSTDKEVNPTMSIWGAIC